MYLDKLETLTTNLSRANLFNSYYDKMNERKELYQTTHENFLVDITPSKGYEHDEDNLSIKFKDLSNNEMFKVSFRNYHDFDANDFDGENIKSLKLLINNSIVDDKKIVSEILEKANFNNFLDKEIAHAISEHKKILKQDEEKKAKEKLEKEQAIQNLLSNLDKNSEASNVDLDQIKKLISGINDTSVRNFFTYKENKDDFYHHEPTVKYHDGRINNLQIGYKIISDHSKIDYPERTEITVVNKNKSINFEIILTSYKSIGEYEKTYLSLRLDDKSISDKNTIKQIIGSTPIINYLESLHSKVKTLDLAEYAERSISSSINEKLNAIKAQELLDKLANKPIAKNLDFDTMPIEINGTKIWLNKDLKLDRKDGPAVEDFNGRDFWFKNGIAYLPNGNQEVLISESESRKYNNGVLIKEETPSIINESSSDKINPHNMGISRLVDKLRNIFSSEDKNKKPKM